MKKTLFVLVGLAVTVLSLVYALWGVDFAQILTLLREANYWVLVPFMVCLVLFYLFNALRWVLILRPMGRFTVVQTFSAMMIGFAGNNLFPVRLGELVRSVVFARQFHLPASGVLVTVGLERVLDVFALLIFYLIAVLMGGSLPEGLQQGAEALAISMGVVCLMILLFLHRPGRFIGWWDRLAVWLPRLVREKGHALLSNAATGLSSLKSWYTLSWLVVYSLLRWAMGGVMVWLSLMAFGAAISFQVALIVLAVIALAVTVPSSPGFFGPIQAAYVFALLPFGITREVAVAASMFFLVAQWLPVTVVGVACFLATGLKLREVRRAAEEEPV